MVVGKLTVSVPEGLSLVCGSITMMCLQVIGPNGLLKNKTRILVTHGLSFIRNADPIVVMDGAL